MVISVDDAKRFITTNVEDSVLEAMLQALELSIQRYTNNNFQRELIDGEYPMDVKMGVVNMLKWDLANREKVGIKAETISRYHVEYLDMEIGEHSIMGYPKSLLGFLKPYIRARF